MGFPQWRQKFFPAKSVSATVPPVANPQGTFAKATDKPFCPGAAPSKPSGQSAPSAIFILLAALAGGVDASEERRLMAEGARLFNAERFFDCHEVWEDVWNAQPPAERKFLQGLIQIAVGCEHFNRGNLPGAVALLERGLGKIGNYGSRHRGVRLAQLNRDARAALALIRLVQTKQAAASAVRLPALDFDAGAFLPAGAV